MGAAKGPGSYDDRLERGQYRRRPRLRDVVTGAVLCSRKDPRASGAGAAIMLQGLFLLLHDAHHAHGIQPG